MGDFMNPTSFVQKILGQVGLSYFEMVALGIGKWQCVWVSKRCMLFTKSSKETLDWFVDF